MHKRYLQSNAFRWTLELVGSPQRLLINIAIFTIVGIGCILPSSNSAALILFLGGIITCTLNYCVYRLAQVCSRKVADKSITVNLSHQRMRLLFWIDTIIILVLSCLILTDILSSAIFKVIACPLMPTIQLLGMRGLLIFYLT
jgi:hypothetical protein